jgi:hypothetical protein
MNTTKNNLPHLRILNTMTPFNPKPLRQCDRLGY